MNTENNPQESGQDLHESMTEIYNQDEDVEEVIEEEQPEETAETEDVTEEIVQDDQTEVVEEVPEEPPLQPHDLWEPHIKEGFPNLPREQQQYMLDAYNNFNSGYQKKFQDLAEERKTIEAINQSFAGPEISQYLNMNGLSVPQATQIFAAHMQNILRDPKAGLQTFAGQLGIDLNSLTEEQEWVDPQIKAANQQVQQLQQTQAQMQQQIQSAEQERKMHALKQEIETWASITDQTGKLLRPRFEELRESMMEISNANPALNLDQLYYLAEQQAPAAPAPEVTPKPATDPQVVKRARAASKKVVSKTNSKGPNPQNQSIDDYLKAQWNAQA